MEHIAGCLTTLGLLFLMGSDLTNAQQGWTTQNSGVSTYLLLVKTVSPRVAWVTGSYGVVLRTTDAGSTWNGGRAFEGNGNPWALAATDERVALVATEDSAGSRIAKIYRTTDGSASWIEVFSQEHGFIDAIRMFDALNGVALGDPVNGKWTILRTSDGGMTWEHFLNEPPQIGKEYGLTESLAAIDPMHIWFGTDSSWVYRTTDGGASWTRHVVCRSPHIWCIQFFDAMCGVAGTGDLYRTTDGGLTWYWVQPPITTFAPIVSVGTTDFWIVSSFQNVSHSSNRGETWSFSYGAPVYLSGIDFVQTPTEVAGWVVGSGGFIARYHDVLSSTDRGSASLPEAFVLGQNYPNPFNPMTSIEYTLGGVGGHLPAGQAGGLGASNVKLVVYDVLGREVALLVNEVKQPGTYSVEFNAACLASGVYVYQLQSAGVVQTRRMVLIR